MTSFDDDVRNAIYASIVSRGEAPSVNDVASAYRFAASEVADAYRTLAEGHVIVLRRGTLDVRWAPPFSAVPTAFRVRAANRTYHAPCAWDAFGIPAALRQDAEVAAHCAFSGEPIVADVTNGTAHGTALVHLLVPAAHFWDDIGFT